MKAQTSPNLVKRPDVQARNLRNARITPIRHNPDGSTTLILSHQGQELPCTIDTADYPTIKTLSWTIAKAKGGKTFYAVHWNRRVPGTTRTKIYTHTLIRSIEDREEIDHVDRNGLNNRRNNLRSTTRRENMWNTGTHSSKFKGLYWDTRNQKACANQNRKTTPVCFASSSLVAKATRLSHPHWSCSNSSDAAYSRTRDTELGTRSTPPQSTKSSDVSF